MVGWLAGLLNDWWLGRLVGWLNDWWLEWLVGLVDRMVVLVGLVWLVGWLVLVWLARWGWLAG